MIPGAAEEQVMPYIDYLAAMDDYYVKIVLSVFMYLQMMAKPTMSAYTTVDSWTYGNAKHVVLIIVGIVAYISVYYGLIVFKFFFGYTKIVVLSLYNLVFRSNQTAGTSGSGMHQTYESTSTSTASNMQSGQLNDDEFEF